MGAEKDIRDVARAYLDSRSLDEYYATMYPRPEAGVSPWGPVSNLTDGEIRKVILSYHLRRRWNLTGPAGMADDYLRIVVSRNAMGREQAVRTHIGETKRRTTIWSRLWPFGRKTDAAVTE